MISVTNMRCLSLPRDSFPQLPKKARFGSRTAASGESPHRELVPGDVAGQQRLLRIRQTREPPMPAGRVARRPATTQNQQTHNTCKSYNKTTTTFLKKETGNYSRAIDTYLSVSETNSSDPDRLEEAREANTVRSILCYIALYDIIVSILCNVR